VDDIRQLRENVVLNPMSGRYKVYLLDEVHMLSSSAENALLKTLEEPPPHVIFVLARRSRRRSRRRSSRAASSSTCDGADAAGVERPVRLRQERLSLDEAALHEVARRQRQPPRRDQRPRAGRTYYGPSPAGAGGRPWA
jgi:hypothetical protein